MKKQMIASLEESNKSLQSTMQKMTDSMSLMVEGISSRMRMIAMAMSGQTQHQFHPSHPVRYNSMLMCQNDIRGRHKGYNSVISPDPEFSGQLGVRSYTPSPTPSNSVSTESDDHGYLRYSC